MRNKKRISEDRLDEMLKNYCHREPQYIFNVRTEEKVMKRKPTFRYAAACLCVAVLLCGGLIALQYTAFNTSTENNPSSGSKAHNTIPSFIVTAYAAENNEFSGTELSGVDTKICPFIPTVMKEYSDIEYNSQGISVSGDNPLEYGESSATLTNICNLRLDKITLEISDENIDSFDVSTGNGYFNYLNMDAYREYHNSEGSDTDKYFKMGTSINDIPYDNENPDNSIVYWFPSSDKLDSEIREITGLEDVSYEYYENAKIVSSEKENLLKTAEDFTKYFGGTITITVHYKDGTTETGKINISFDENGFANAYITKA